MQEEVLGLKVKCSERGSSKPLIWQSSILYKLLIHWRILVILMSIEVLSPPGEINTGHRAKNIRWDSMLSPTSQPHMSYPQKSHLLWTEVWDSWEARKTTLMLRQKSPADQAQWAYTTVCRQGLGGDLPRGPSQSDLPSCTYFWATRGKTGVWTLGSIWIT